MSGIIYNETMTLDIGPFSTLVGEEVANFIFENAPRKVATRIAKALYHFERSAQLEDIDEEMGAMRLIAGEEELVVAIFEWLKLNEAQFPEQKDFVRKFKNHIVKLAFYPVLRQFRFVISGMFEHGITMNGLEGVIDWTIRPVVDGKQIKLAILDHDGREIIRHDPFAVDISHGECNGDQTIPVLLASLAETVQNQQGITLKQFLMRRAEYRNHLLYATDGGSAAMHETLAELREQFAESYHDLLWVLALLIGGKPVSKTWGLASQFIGVYRLALIETGILRADNSVSEEPSSASTQS